ncbi:MAG: FliG C-terminal domain-containing protein [Lachnospiraceae bacterium]
MLNELFFCELRKLHTELYELEKDFSAEEKRQKHQMFAEVAELIMNLALLARKEGLLALEEAAKNIGDDEYHRMLKKLITYVVDGTEPELIWELAFCQHFSTNHSPYTGLVNLLYIKSVLAIQDGVHPHVIKDFILNILPDDVAEILNNTKEEHAENIDLNALCEQKMQLEPQEPEYYEIHLCDEIINKLGDRSLQRVLREVDRFSLLKVMKGISGEGRRCVFHNLSKNIASEMAEELWSSYNQSGNEKKLFQRYELGDMQKAAKEVLDVIGQLKASGEIIVNFTY